MINIVLDPHELITKIGNLNAACQKFIVSNGKMSQMLQQTVQMGGHPKALIELGEAIKVNGEDGEQLGTEISGLMEYLQDVLSKRRMEP